MDIYDEEIAYTDKSIGELIDAVDALELKDNTVIIITSDHGEEFLDRTRFGHGNNTYQELIHVPLIIYSPLEEKLKGRRVRHSVETRDIPKTVLEISGIEDSHFGGNNLLNVAEQSDDPNG